MNRNDFIINEKASRDTIDVKRAYIMMAGDHAAGVLLSQIIYWHLPDKEGNPTRLTIKRNDHLWLAKKRNDWWDEICMLPKQFDRAIKELENRELVKTELFRFGGSPTKHIRLNWDMFLRVYEAIINDDKPSFNPDNPEGGKWIFPIREYGNSRLGNMETPEQGISQTPPKPTPAVAPTLAEVGPKITTEITTENHPGPPVINTPGVEDEKNDNDKENKEKCSSNPDSKFLQKMDSKTLNELTEYMANIRKGLLEYDDIEEPSIRNQRVVEVPLLRKWFDAGIPKACVLAGVKTTMSRHKKGKKVQSVKYFEKEVQNAFAEYNKAKAQDKAIKDSTSNSLSRMKELLYGK